MEDEYKQKNDKFFIYKENIREHLINEIMSSPDNIPNGCDREPYEDIEFNHKYSFADDLLPAISSEYLQIPKGQARQSTDKCVRFWLRLPESKEALVVINLASNIANKKCKHIFDVCLNNNFSRTVTLDNNNKTEIKIPILKDDIKRKIQKIEFKLHNQNKIKQLFKKKIDKIELRFFSLQVDEYQETEPDIKLLPF